MSAFSARFAGRVGHWDKIEIGFGAPAQNDRVVPDAVAAIAALGLAGGEGLLITGPASLPAAFAISHAVAHLYQFVAVYDPKLTAYVVAISHGDRRLGELVREEAANKDQP